MCLEITERNPKKIALKEQKKDDGLWPIVLFIEPMRLPLLCIDKITFFKALKLQLNLHLDEIQAHSQHEELVLSNQVVNLNRIKLNFSTKLEFCTEGAFDLAIDILSYIEGERFQEISQLGETAGVSATFL